MFYFVYIKPKRIKKIVVIKVLRTWSSSPRSAHPPLLNTLLSLRRRQLEKRRLGTEITRFAVARPSHYEDELASDTDSSRES